MSDSIGQLETNLPHSLERRGNWFATTHWSVILTARNGQGADAEEALAKLYRTYWPPLYAFICRDGYPPEESKDLLQEFFLRLIQRDYLQYLRHRRGKFRSFLLTFLKHFLQEHRGKARAQKRGGGVDPIPLDDFEANPFMVEPVDHFSPDQVFERRWAQTVFQVGLTRLEQEFVRSGKAALFAVLKDFQPREAGAPSYAQVGASFGMTEAAVKSAVQRLRQRHREILREEIAKTVGRPEDIEEEIRHLRNVLARPGP